MKIVLNKYSHIFLDLSWKWLNDKEIMYLTNTKSFTKEDQIKWYNTIFNRPDYKIWGISADDKPIGVCGLKKITNNECEYWGYIGEKEYWGKGIGTIIMNLLEKKAISYNLNSIWLQVLKSNHRAQKLYHKMGYKIEKEEFSVIIMRKKL